MSSYIAKGSYLLEIQEGNPRDVTFVIPDEIVMTSRKAKLQIRKNGTSEVIMGVDTDGGKIVKNGQRVICSFTGADSLSKAGTYVWDLIVYTSSTDVITVGRGTANIIGRITRIA